jgi:hypothetical protein
MPLQKFRIPQARDLLPAAVLFALLIPHPASANPMVIPLDPWVFYGVYLAVVVTWIVPVLLQFHRLGFRARAALPLLVPMGVVTGVLFLFPVWWEPPHAPLPEVLAELAVLVAIAALAGGVLLCGLSRWKGLRGAADPLSFQGALRISWAGYLAAGALAALGSWILHLHAAAVAAQYRMG